MKLLLLNLLRLPVLSIGEQAVLSRNPGETPRPFTKTWVKLLGADRSNP